MNQQTLWQALAERGLVSGDPPANSDHPWPIRLMVGAGAWAGSLFVLAFLAALTVDLLDHSATRLVIAGLSLGAGRVLAGRRELLTEQLGLIAAALAQSLVAWSIFDDIHGQVGIALGLIALGLVSLWVPLALFRVWSALLCLIATVLLIDGLEIPGSLALISVVCAGLAAAWWFHPLLNRHYALWRSLAIAAALFALGAAITLSRATVLLWLGEDSAFAGAAWTSFGMLGINLAVVWGLANAQRINPIAPMLLIAMLVLATWTTPAVAAALLLILLGYGRGEHWLLGLGLIGLPLALSAHYYVMSWSLNLKALSLTGVGVLLLAARQWIRLQQPEIGAQSAQTTGAEL